MHAASGQSRLGTSLALTLSLRCQASLLCLVLCLATAGCATHAKQLTSIRDAYYSGRLDQAETLTIKQIAKSKSDSDVLKLERAMIELSSGRPQQAEQTLREVRDRFDDFEQKDIGEGALSLLTDDTRRAYAGEDYEKVLIRCFLALSNLMRDGSDSVPYALQVGQKQQDIILAGGDDAAKNPKLAYKRVALGAYLHAAVQEATHRNYDDAARSIQLVVNWEPGFKSGPKDLERATTGRHSEPGNGVLYVFTLVGRGPFKEEKFEKPTSDALLIADRILSITGKHSLPPTIAPIKVPVVRCGHSRISTVRVAVDGQSAGQTETITDVGQMAVDQYKATKNQVLARAVARRVIKKGAIYATKEAVQVDNPFVELALDGVGVAWEATESADTRCWGLLPDKIQVLRIELPAGSHDISLAPLTAGSSRGPVVARRVMIDDGRNSYMLATFPDERLVGEVLVCQSAEARLEHAAPPPKTGR